ncbi:hypothetical protein [Nocardia aurea]|uniref:hypothetical protein n=1 Tax=Nocardia aurea TaxID=2144174 RepID=UPI0033A4BC8A
MEYQRHVVRSELSCPSEIAAELDLDRVEVTHALVAACRRAVDIGLLAIRSTEK